jgi:hypothetical protein
MNQNPELFLKLLQEIQKVQAFLKQGHRSGFQQLQDDWLDGQQVLQMLNISPRTLQGLRNSRDLAYSKIRGKLYYRTEDIEKLLESNYNFKPARIQRHGTR